MSDYSLSKREFSYKFSNKLNTVKFTPCLMQTKPVSFAYQDRARSIEVRKNRNIRSDNPKILAHNRLLPRTYMVKFNKLMGKKQSLWHKSTECEAEISRTSKTKNIMAISPARVQKVQSISIELDTSKQIAASSLKRILKLSKHLRRSVLKIGSTPENHKIIQPLIIYLSRAHDKFMIESYSTENGVKERTLCYSPRNYGFAHHNSRNDLEKVKQILSHSPELRNLKPNYFYSLHLNNMIELRINELAEETFCKFWEDIQTVKNLQVLTLQMQTKANCFNDSKLLLSYLSNLQQLRLLNIILKEDCNLSEFFQSLKHQQAVIENCNFEMRVKVLLRSTNNKFETTDNLLISNENSGHLSLDTDVSFCSVKTGNDGIPIVGNREIDQASLLISKTSKLNQICVPQFGNQYLFESFEKPHRIFGMDSTNDFKSMPKSYGSDKSENSLSSGKSKSSYNSGESHSHSKSLQSSHSSYSSYTTSNSNKSESSYDSKSSHSSHKFDTPQSSQHSSSSQKSLSSKSSLYSHSSNKSQSSRSSSSPKHSHSSKSSHAWSNSQKSSSSPHTHSPEKSHGSQSSLNSSSSKQTHSFHISKSSQNSLSSKGSKSPKSSGVTSNSSNSHSSEKSSQVSFSSKNSHSLKIKQEIHSTCNFFSNLSNHGIGVCMKIDGDAGTNQESVQFFLHLREGYFALREIQMHTKEYTKLSQNILSLGPVIHTLQLQSNSQSYKPKHNLLQFAKDFKTRASNFTNLCHLNFTTNNIDEFEIIVECVGSFAALMSLNLGFKNQDLMNEKRQHQKSTTIAKLINSLAKKDHLKELSLQLSCASFSLEQIDELFFTVFKLQKFTKLTLELDLTNLEEKEAKALLNFLSLNNSTQTCLLEFCWDTQQVKNSLVSRLQDIRTILTNYVVADRKSIKRQLKTVFIKRGT